MNSEHSSLAVPWYPSRSNPVLTAVSVPHSLLMEGGLLGQEDYEALLRLRMLAECRRLGPEKVRELLEEFDLPGLEPALSMPLESVPQFLLEEAPQVHEAVWREAGIEGWPRKVEESDRARRVLVTSGLREFLTQALAG